jgi:xanthine dehydrogenase accessory factor
MKKPIAGPAEVLAQVEPLLKEHGRLVLCQIVRTEGSSPGKAGWRLLARPDGEVIGNLGGGAFEALVTADARAKLGDATSASEIKRYYFTEKAVRGQPTGMVCGGLAEVFLEVMTSPPLFVICGGGPVGQALASAGSAAGFETLVADDRPDFRRPELFPEGTALAEVSRDYVEDFLASWFQRELFVAVVTRCWETDTAALASVLRQAPPRLTYLGLMGSRRKVERVRQEVTRRGFDPEPFGLRTPIGLPIGGDTPGEIAVSILAEMIQVRHQGHESQDQEDPREEPSAWEESLESTG